MKKGGKERKRPAKRQGRAAGDKQTEPKMLRHTRREQRDSKQGQEGLSIKEGPPGRRGRYEGDEGSAKKKSLSRS